MTHWVWEYEMKTPLRLTVDATDDGYIAEHFSLAAIT